MSNTDPSHLWQPGQTAALRGIFNQRVWLVQSNIVVRDTPDETVLLLMPGAQCVVPWHDGRWPSHQDLHAGRWQLALSGGWSYHPRDWDTNRFLIILEPLKYYATILIWQQATDEFRCYYINFQLPFQRSHCGFDTLDLDLDLVIRPDYTWQWKDEDEYLAGIDAGGILPAWVENIEASKKDLMARIEQRRYPLDSTWRHWRPDPARAPPQLPAGWDRC